MRTSYRLKHVPERYGRDLGDPRTDPVVGAGAVRRTRLQQEANQAARRAARARVVQQFEAGRLKYTPDSQPRDTAGKFRRVLARLKMNLGDAASEQLAREMEKAAAAGALGDYAKAKEAGTNVVKLVESVKEKDIQSGTIDNIRRGARDLGKLLAYLPLPQGNTAEKVRFSDLPPPVSSLIQDLVKRVKAKLDPEDAAKYVAILQEFMAGGRTMSSDEMSSELSRVLRVLA